MAVIYHLSALTFDVRIDELDINKIQVGQKVEITADALDGEQFPIPIIIAIMFEA